MSDDLSQNNLLLTALTNPVNPADRIIGRTPLKPGASLDAYVKGLFPNLPTGLENDLDLIVSVNGAPIDVWEEIYPVINDSIVVKVVPHGGGGGGGKDIVRMVAMVAVMVAAPQLSVFAAQGLAAVGISFTPGIASILTGAIGMAGMMLVNAILPPSLPDVPSMDLGEYSPTYSWNSIGNISTESRAWPVLYGTARVAPYLISQHVTTDGDNQYLNLLYGVADHAVDSIANTEINGTPSSYFDDIEIETKLGSNGQTAIQYFNDTISEKSSGARLSTDWATIRTDSNAAQGLGVALSCPSGLYYANDQGGLSEQTLTISIEHRKVGDTPWTAWDNETITAADRSPIRRVFRKDDLTAGEYDVRVKFESAPNTGARYMTLCYFDYVQEIIYDDFSYPGASLAAVKALATDQLSGSQPKVSFLVQRSTVQAYVPGSGWTAKPANNPAWACYDAHVNGDYGGNVPYARMNYSEFSDWADFCTTNGYEVNFYIDTEMPFPKAIEQIGLIGRGQVVQRGTKFGCVMDKADTPSQVFTMGNIVEATYEETFIEKKDRANVVEVTYFDADLEYSRQTIKLFSSDYDPTTDEENLASLALYGCTSKTLAIKHGTFLLNCNRYLLRIVSFEADIDALAAIPGDVIHVAHDIPQWGESGRIVSAASETAVLDRDITMTAGGGPYKLMVRHSADDTIEEVTIEAADYTGDTVTIDAAGTWTTIPSEDDVYSFGPTSTVTKKFRIISITRSSDQRRKITALEYNDLVYTDTATLPAYEPDVTFNFVQALSATEIWKEGTGQGVMHLSWRGEALLWRVFYRESGSSHWIKIGETSQRFFEVPYLLPDKTYEFSVSGTNTPGNQTGESMSVSEIFNGWGNLTLDAPLLSGLQIVDQANDTVWAGKHLKLTWNPVTDAYVSADGEINGASTFPPYAELGHYRVRICDSDGTRRREVDLQDNFFDYTYEMNVEDGKSSALLIKAWAILKSGATSASPAILNVNNPAPSAISDLQVQGTGSTTFWTGRDVTLSWTDATDTDLKNYKIIVKDADDSVRRTEYVATPFYVYSLNKNTDDALSSSLKFSVQAQDEFGSLSSTTTISLSNSGPSAVANLQIHGTGSTTQWAGRDVALVWDDATAINGDIKDYKVIVKDADTTIRRTEYVTDPFYIYTHDKNAEDSLSNSLIVSVQARDEFGSLSTASEVTISNPAPSAVSNLQIQGTGSTTQWAGDDVILTWDASSDTDISDYKVVVKDAGLTERRTEYVTDPFYVYSYDKNTEDTRANSLVVTVQAQDGFGSLATAASVSISNPAPTTPSGLSATPFMGGVQFRWTASTDPDVSEYEYRVNVGAMPSGAWVATQDIAILRNLTESEKSAYGGNATIYFEVRAIDDFGSNSGSASTNAACESLNTDATDITDFSIIASKLHTKAVVLAGDTWSNDTPSANYVTWSAHTLYYNGAAYSIAGGNTNLKYIYWLNGSGTYTASDTNPTLGDGDFVIATNIDGAHDLAWNAIANQVIGSAYIQNAAIISAKIANLAVTNAHINDLSAAKINAGYLDVANRIQAGSMVVSLFATDATDRMFSGATRDYADLGGATKPADNATVGAAWGSNLTDRPAELTDGRIATALHSGGHLQTKVLPGSNVGTPGGAGLYLGADYLGFYSGTEWTAYIDSNGHFTFKKDANNYIAWTGANLDVKGSITITGGSGIANLTDAGALAAKDSVDLSTSEVTNKSLANVDSTASTKLGTIATGADVTSANTAAGISGQGALATKSAVNLATSEVTNKSLANVDLTANTKLGTIATGADVTSANTAAGIAGQGVLATKSAVDLSTTEVTNKSLANVDSPANTKLGTIAEGATVGAAWGSNLTGRPTELTDGRVSAGLDNTGTLASKAAPDTNIGTPGSTGLYLGADYLGYYNTVGGWRSYIKGDGTFKFYGDGNNNIEWNGTALYVYGQIVLKSGSSGVANLSDAGALATADNVDWNTEVSNRASELTDGRITAGLNSSGEIQKIVKASALSGTQSTDGLYMTSTHMGYLVSGSWVSYINDSGQFAFQGDANNSVIWNGTTLSVKGAITINSGSAGIANLSDAGSLATADDLDDVGDGSTYKRTTATEKTGASYAYAGLNSSGYLTTKVLPGTNVGTPAGAGLYLGADYMGYYSGSVWATYMDSSGNWKLSGDANNYLSWNGATLSIKTNETDAITIEDGGDIKIKVGGDIIFETTTSDTSELVFSNSLNDFKLTSYEPPTGYNTRWHMYSTVDNRGALYLGRDESLTDKRFTDIDMRAYTNIELKAGTNVRVWAGGGTAPWSFSDTLFAHTATPTKHADVGSSLYAFDDVYADDFQNVADFPFLDKRLDKSGKQVKVNDLEIIRNIKHSGNYDPRTGLATQDDDTLPDWLYTVNKADVEEKDNFGKIIKFGKKGEKAIDPDGKPFLSLKTGVALAWGGIRQLDREVHQKIAALKDEIASLKEALAA